MAGAFPRAVGSAVPTLTGRLPVVKVSLRGGQTGSARSMRKTVPSTPANLRRALEALERDHEFLLRGDVFTKDLIETWIEWKRTYELKELQLRPHPYEFHLYYDS